MEVKVVLLSCALLAICLSYLPKSDAVACDDAGLPTGCTDCSDALNVAHPDCVLDPVTTLAPETTAAPTVTDPPAGGATTAGTGTGTGTTAAPAAGKKTRRKRKWRVVRRPGKTVIKRRRNKNKKLQKWSLKGF
ncbi:uncharacterized protein LOC6576848 [Drosophila mojavensis]|uniref:Uncharacterized protein n=1 Tax=Drosophila mojavensis TaxID=7230 RepID=B4KHJ5_DROMO|nr:uncharacterized protein LOC6576848 [Drosophila mojavensis]EDW12274.1 uncharacterized protein Dmoj_GI10868 [Drosophila mojavensis]